jgi:hypothetical protein
MLSGHFGTTKEPRAVEASRSALSHRRRAVWAAFCRVARAPYRRGKAARRNNGLIFQQVACNVVYGSSGKISTHLGIECERHVFPASSISR